MQYFAGEPMYIVGRQRDTDEVLHSGNIEHRGGYTKDKQTAMDLRDRLNRGEEE